VIENYFAFGCCIIIIEPYWRRRHHVRWGIYPFTILRLSGSGDKKLDVLRLTRIVPTYRTNGVKYPKSTSLKYTRPNLTFQRRPFSDSTFQIRLFSDSNILTRYSTLDHNVHSFLIHMHWYAKLQKRLWSGFKLNTRAHIRYHLTNVVHIQLHPYDACINDDGTKEYLPLLEFVCQTSTYDTWSVNECM